MDINIHLAKSIVKSIILCLVRLTVEVLWRLVGFGRFFENCCGGRPRPDFPFVKYQNRVGVRRPEPTQDLQAKSVGQAWSPCFNLRLILGKDVGFQDWKTGVVHWLFGEQNTDCFFEFWVGGI